MSIATTADAEACHHVTSKQATAVISTTTGSHTGHTDEREPHRTTHRFLRGGFFIVLSILFFTVVSWIIFGLLKLTKLYDPNGETITDALTLTIGFHLIATAAAVVIKEADILFLSYLDDSQLQILVISGALGSAILFIFIRIFMKLPEKSLWRITKATLIILVRQQNLWVVGGCGSFPRA